MIVNDFELSALRCHQPHVRTEASLIKASVALILRDTADGLDTEVLLMQRAKHEKDPWSGQMSFPGGKIDPEDVSPKAAAVREAFEEVGVALTEQGYLGQLDDILGFKVNGVHAVHITPHVFKPNEPVDIVVNHEVADTVWLPFSWLADPGKSFEFYSPRDKTRRMPAMIINQSKEQVLWGLSLRIMAILHEVMGREMTVLTDDEHEVLKHLHERNINREKPSQVSSNVID